MSRGDVRTVRLLAVAAAAFLVLAFAASGDVVHVWDEPPPAGIGRRTQDGDTLVPVTIVDAEPEGDREQFENGWLTQVALVLFALIVAYLVYTLTSTWSRWLVKFGLRKDPVRASVLPLPTIEPPVVVVDEEAQLAALREGSPRNAIVACWLRMEDDVAAAGLPKQPAETSTEYTTRVLSSTSLDPAPVGELAALYREARFSRHELNQTHRERALAALVQIHRALAAHAAAIAARAADDAVVAHGADDTVGAR